MAGALDRLTQSPTFRAYQGQLPPIKTGAAAGYDLSGGQSVPAECPAEYQAGYRGEGAFPERGLLPPFEDRFADFPEALRWRMISSCRRAMEECLQEVRAEIRGLSVRAAIREDIIVYYKVLAAAHIAGVDAEETRRRLRPFLAAIQEQAMAAAVAPRRA